MRSLKTMPCTIPYVSVPKVNGMNTPVKRSSQIYAILQVLTHRTRRSPFNQRASCSEEKNEISPQCRARGCAVERRILFSHRTTAWNHAASGATDTPGAEEIPMLLLRIMVVCGPLLTVPGVCQYILCIKYTIYNVGAPVVVSSNLIDIYC
jgi:hypothetical protein